MTVRTLARDTRMWILLFAGAAFVYLVIWGVLLEPLVHAMFVAGTPDDPMLRSTPGLPSGDGTCANGSAQIGALLTDQAVCP